VSRSRPATTRRRRSLAPGVAHSGERGSVTVEHAILFPVLLVLLLSAVQAALWWHTRNVALAAAQAGVAAGRSAGATPDQAVPAATSFIRRAGAGLTDITVTTGGTTATTIRVQVGVTAPRVLPIPGLTLHITQTAEAGRERFTTPASRR
jgi:Flp pilus assembly protein TadG